MKKKGTAGEAMGKSANMEADHFGGHRPVKDENGSGRVG